MAHPNVLYSTYGAYELKRRYQFNLFMGTVITTSFIGIILLGSVVISGLDNDLAPIDTTPRIIEIVADMGPPPSVAPRLPQVRVNRPDVPVPKVGTLVAVDDDDWVGDEMTLATRDEMAQLIRDNNPVLDDSRGEIMVDIDDVDYLPEPDEFVPVQILPEMIFQHTPEYPRMMREIGIGGVVWVKALVDKEGNVRDAQVGRSSGFVALDEAAVAAAMFNKFKPGIQNGLPVNVWVTYKVTFESTK